AEGLPWLPRPELLTDDELVRLVRIAVQRLGVTEVRFTGGEPLLRPTLVDLVRRVAELRPRPRVALTTNGIGLTRSAPSPVAARRRAGPGERLAGPPRPGPVRRAPPPAPAA